MKSSQEDINNSRTFKKNPIVIIAAMEIEFNFLLDKLENVTFNQISKFKYYEGEFNKYPVVICQCYVNTINASLATYIAIEKYHPILIINEGTAGSHGKDMHKSDIVICSKCLNMSSIQTPSKREGEGSNSLKWSIVNFACDGEDDQIKFQIADPKLIKIAQSIEYKNGHIYTGVVSSGDIWNKEIDRILWFNQKFGSLCEEMECYAVYTVANNFKIPVIAIKVISNNEIINESFDENVAVHSQEFVYNYILTLAKEYL